MGNGGGRQLTGHSSGGDGIRPSSRFNRGSGAAVVMEMLAEGEWRFSGDPSESPVELGKRLEPRRQGGLAHPHMGIDDDPLLQLQAGRTTPVRFDAAMRMQKGFLNLESCRGA